MPDEILGHTLEEWEPMSPDKGPPLPKFLGIYWPWYKPAVPPIYACPICGEQFSTQAELLAHIASAHPGEPPQTIYVCPICGAQFSTIEEYNQHIATEHLPAVYTCPICGTEFASQDALNAHIASAHPEQPPVVGVQITSITLDKTSLIESDPFTIAITFSNPFDYDVWVRPVFAFGLLTGEPLELVLEPPVGPPRPKLVVKGFAPEAVLSGWDYIWDKNYDYANSEWVNLGHPQHPGSNMRQFVYDPDGIPVIMPGGGEGECWLKIPAKGQATTSRLWYISFYARSKWVDYSPYPYYVISGYEVYPPIDLNVCVKVENPFYLVYDKGWATRTVGGISAVLNWRPIGLGSLVSATPYTVNVMSTKTPGPPV